ncbi:MAG: hypothetical protein K6U02_04220 [Firmicutes bacterium]|nr:hypothetical protein [Bacillota bacterium]
MRNADVAALVWVSALLGTLAFAQQPGQHPHEHHAQQGVAQSMAPGQMHHGAHMTYTPERKPTDEDRRRAEQIVRTLRTALERYKDYRVAIGDGYQPFLPNVPLPEHHFTNYRLGFEAAFRFDPARPTSLLYKRLGDGWELVGAMYTAPQRFTLEQLNERVPLSIARWHQHVNICLPQPGQGAQADWTKFGPQGSIATREACEAEGGRFFPVLFGWMVHVYPWAESPELVWRH